MIVRPEAHPDRAAVRRVNEAAFGRPDEADLVDRLRTRAAPYLGLVAERDGEVVGHIAFTPVTLDPPRPDLTLRGLAPMAVLPAHQRTGVGTALVEAGIAACRAGGAAAVVVLGHPGYYPRFGFRQASLHGLRCIYEAPEDAFMVLPVLPGGLGGASGVVHYAPAFGG